MENKQVSRASLGEYQEDFPALAADSAVEGFAPAIDLSKVRSPQSLRNRIGRATWSVIWFVLFRPSLPMFNAWRRLLLRLFGAKIGRGVRIYPSVRVWAPWHLEMGDYSCLGPHVNCYCVAPIRIGPHAMVSQYSFLCSASHDYELPELPLVTCPIVIEEGAWVAADVFICKGVTVGAGAVVGARSSIFKNVEPWSVVGGNPARFIKRRALRQR